MSNKAVIQQVTTITHKTKETSKSVSVFDDYEQGSILLDEFFDDDMELLKFVIKESQKPELQAVYDVLDSVYAYKKGLEIEGTWYDWEQIEPFFENK